ncbi:MAG TPA: hypothetical protein EYG65_05350 [Rhodospirillales bacterium]|nr:hypothetical protein [Rhodospirillales bacterium]
MGDRRDPFDTLLILRGGNRRETFKENRPATTYSVQLHMPSYCRVLNKSYPRFEPTAFGSGRTSRFQDAQA